MKSHESATLEKSGRLTVRLPPSIHAKLIDVADGLGLDANSLVNMMVREAFPKWERKAKILAVLNAANAAAVAFDSPDDPNDALTSLFARLDALNDEDFKLGGEAIASALVTLQAIASNSADATAALAAQAEAKRASIDAKKAALLEELSELEKLRTKLEQLKAKVVEKKAEKERKARSNEQPKTPRSK